MKFEQPANLNRYIYETIPLTWALRWRGAKPAIPLLAACSLILIEMAAFRIWLRGESLIAAAPRLLIVVLAPFAMALAITEIEIRIEQCSKRRLRLDPKYVWLAPSRNSRFVWATIREWCFEPIHGHQDLCKLTVHCALNKKAKRTCAWQIVLSRSCQQPELLSALEHFRRLGVNEAPLVQLDKPCVAIPRRTLPVRFTLSMALSYWLLVHALPLLGIGLLPNEPAHDSRGSSSTFTKQEGERLGRTFVQFFSSVEDAREFCLLTGGIMGALAYATFRWGDASIKPTRTSLVPDSGS